MEFTKFLTRINEEIIQDIIGTSAVQILGCIDTETVNISTLRTSLLNIYSPVELLTNTIIRNQLLDVLREEEARELCTKLNVEIKTDCFTTLKSVNFKRQINFDVLLKFFKIDNENSTSNIEVPHSFIANVNYPLFIHQRKAISKLISKLYDGEKKVMLHMPTGSGKTRTAMNVICNHFRLFEPTIVVWLAHSIELCEQAVLEFETAWKNLGNRDIEVKRFWGNNNEKFNDINDCFIVGGLAKFSNLISTVPNEVATLAGKTTLVVMDEAHMSIAPTYNLNLRVLLTFKSSLLGLSATPGRTWNKPNADLELSEFFNRQKVTLEIEGYENPVDYLIKENYLAKVKNSPLLYESGIELTKNDYKYLNENFLLSENFLKRLSKDQMRNLLIIQKVTELIKRHKRIILFALNVAHSNLLATCLQAIEVNAFSITSNTDLNQRSKILKRFKSDEEISLVLCNYGILTTGFDAPKTSCALITRPTDSLVLYSQMIGRAIRGTKAGGNETAEIVTVIDRNLPGFDEVAKAFLNWEDVW